MLEDVEIVKMEVINARTFHAEMRKWRREQILVVMAALTVDCTDRATAERFSASRFWVMALKSASLSSNSPRSAPTLLLASRSSCFKRAFSSDDDGAVEDDAGADLECSRALPDDHQPAEVTSDLL